MAPESPFGRDELLTGYGTVDVLWFDSYGHSDPEADWSTSTRPSVTRSTRSSN
ncbi:hypothetical protein [Embleya sp. NBC_00896]|uniref:hypothetical protein n=1 Tax=Embleya sp. NBC_00896 TaxID=2975961 RepID=UPI003869ACEF|nr:hypothetical protein OG928_34370 [Embleya sp. NBC_00896]